MFGAIGTGIGVLGFVAAIGGMIVYTRADSSGLPADEALAVMPKDALVAIGAVTLVPAVAMAFLFALVLYCVSWLIDYREKQRIDARLPQAVRIEEEAAYAVDEARQHREASHHAQQRADAAQKGLDALARSPAPSPEDLERLNEACASATEEASREEAEATNSQRRAETLVTSAKKMRAEHAEASKTVQWGVRIAVALALLVLQVVAVVALGSGPEGREQWLILLALAVVTAFVCMTIYSQRSQRLMFIISAFLALGLLIGLNTYYRTMHTPKLEPAAALRADGSIVFGYFVAETDKDVYIARPEGDNTRSRILQLPRSAVTDVAVGRLTAPHFRPLRDAAGIARRLCAEGTRGQTGPAVKAGNKAVAPRDPAPAPVLDLGELRCTSKAEVVRRVRQRRRNH